MSTPYDVVVVGAGIVGLACAWELAVRHAGLRIAVVDQAAVPGGGQSDLDVGILRAEVWQRPVTPTARLGAEGRQRMERFAVEHGIRVKTCGELVVAVTEPEVQRLACLERADPLRGPRLLRPAEMREVEPHVRGLAALHYPRTSLIDVDQVVHTFARLLVDDGVDLLLGRDVLGLEERVDHRVLHTSRGEVLTRRLISCAGIRADRAAGVAVPTDLAGVVSRVRSYAFDTEARSLCRGVISSAGNARSTEPTVVVGRRIDGSVWSGPHFLSAVDREGGRWGDPDWRDLVRMVRDPRFRGLVRSHWCSGAAELWRDLLQASWARELQRYLPELRVDQLTRRTSEVRAHAVSPSGVVPDDVVVVSTEHSLHLVNALRPAATTALSMASRLADEAERSFGRPVERAA